MFILSSERTLVASVHPQTSYLWAPRLPRTGYGYRRWDQQIERGGDESNHVQVVLSFSASSLHKILALAEEIPAEKKTEKSKYCFVSFVAFYSIGIHWKLSSWMKETLTYWNWTRWSLWVHSNSGLSMILWFYSSMILWSYCFLAQWTKPTFNLHQAGLESKGRTRAGRRHFHHLLRSESPSLSSCTNLLPLSILFPNANLHGSTNHLQQVIALSGGVICSNQLLLKSQEAN